MAAPRIEQGGTVTVNGAAAYVAAEAVDLSINQGLFDIFISAGTTDANGVVHTGSTGGPASTGVGDNHRVYMVAVPKNQALTMLLEGNVGFDTATDVTIDNGQIVLSAGHDVFGDFISDQAFAAGDSNLNINSGNWTSDVLGRAATDAFATRGAGPLSFAGDLTLSGGARAHVGAVNGQAVTIGGDVWVDANRDNSFSSDPLDLNALAGEALLYADGGGALTVTGSALVTADATGGIDFETNTAGRSEEHTSELQSLMRISYAVFCLKKQRT